MSPTRKTSIKNSHSRIYFGSRSRSPGSAGSAYRGRLSALMESTRAWTCGPRVYLQKFLSTSRDSVPPAVTVYGRTPFGEPGHRTSPSGRLHARWGCRQTVTRLGRGGWSQGSPINSQTNRLITLVSARWPAGAQPGQPPALHHPVPDPRLEVPAVRCVGTTLASLGVGTRVSGPA